LFVVGQLSCSNFQISSVGKDIATYITNASIEIYDMKCYNMVTMRSLRVKRYDVISFFLSLLSLHFGIRILPVLYMAVVIERLHK